MALFGSNKKTKKATVAKPAPKAEVISDMSGVLLRPRITEKAAHMTAQHTYTFDIAPRATKTDVAKAIKEVYGVTPKKVALVKTLGKKVNLRTRRGYGRRAASKKAYVFLKEGDRIEFAS